MESSSSWGVSQIKWIIFVCLSLISSQSVETKTVSHYASSFSSNPQIEYDVFVSFRGSDIRQGLLSHLLLAFSRKRIVAFVDDKLERGHQITEALHGAIERSLISLVIFSQGYASSRWCLEELVKIIECREKYGQIVVPVFYNVDPSDVRQQKGTYGMHFAEHERKYSKTQVRTWRSALRASADLSGFHSTNFRNDAELIEEIINWTTMNLNHLHQVHSTGLLGIGKPIAHSEPLLRKRSEEEEKQDVIGIWGIGGIGKTTLLAEEVHDIKQEMAWETVRYEGRRRTRLWDSDDIYQVFNHNTGAEVIRSISVINISLIKEVKLRPQVFSKMGNLQFLDFYGENQDYLRPQVFSKMDYPLKSLPMKFPENVVILDLRCNRVLEKLWLGSQVDMEFSKASNVEVEKSERLSGMHVPIHGITNINLISLRYLNLLACISLKEFSLASENMVELNLLLTSIYTFPSSIGRAASLSMSVNHEPVMLKGFAVHPMKFSTSSNSDVSVSFNGWSWVTKRMRHVGKNLVIDIATGLLLCLCIQLLINSE